MTYFKYLASFLIILLFSCEKVEQNFKCDTSCEGKTICLITDKTEAYADGVSEIVLTGCIPIESDESILQVTFEVPTGLGNFSLEGGTTTITKNLDGNKTATARLKVGTVADTYKAKVMVTFQEKTYVDYVDIVLKKNDVKAIAAIFDNDLSILSGDNYTTFKSDITINNFDYQGKSIKVNISGPVTFLNSDQKEILLPLDVLGKTSVKFKTTDSDGFVNIKYYLEPYSVDTTFYVHKSYPDEMRIISNKELVGSNDTVSLDIYLNKKKQGSISKGISISLDAFQITPEGRKEYRFFVPPFLYTSGSDLNKPNAKFEYRTPGELFWNKDLPLFIAGIVNDNGITYARDTLILKIR